jgi:adenylate cyclase class 2
MHSEIEVKFAHIDKSLIRKTIIDLWWVIIQPHTLMRRAIFNIHWDTNGWLRVRDEWNKITMTYKKVVDNFTIDGVKEFEIIVDDFDSSMQFLTSLWYLQKAYQESYREKRFLDWCEICLDEWPWLEPFVEIEWPNEHMVKSLSLKLGYDRENALFWPVNILYVMFLWYDYYELNTINITFDNPLVSRL